LISRTRFTTVTFSAILATATCVPASLQAEAVVNGNDVTFRLDAREWNDKPMKVNVAGTFQGWNKDQIALTDPDLDNVWEVTTRIAEDGEHHYKFVIDGEHWITDATGDKDLEVDDTFGGKNSGVVIGYDLRKAPPPQPDAVNTAVLRHNPADVGDASAFAGSQLRLRFRAQAGDVQRVIAVSNARGTELARLGTENGLDVFGGTIHAPGQGYYFLAYDGTAIAHINATGARTGQAAIDAEKGGANDFPVPSPVVKTPDWARRAVWYQIFPERFRNGDPSNDPGDKPNERLVKWTSDWWKTQPGEAPGTENFYKGKGNVWQRRYGGDLAGLRQGLPYLRQVGINAIYLNPMFEAESMHKYDTSDFRHIDDNFGTKGDLAILTGETDDPATWKWTASDKLFLAFLADAHQQGFKVVIDGVFNHVGRAHPFFQDLLENGKHSRYADWFEITDWGDPKHWHKMADPYVVHGKKGGIRWKAWDQESGHLPVFRKDAKLGLASGPREHIMAITRRWLAPDGDTSKGIDGWRLDVPGDIPHPFWIAWRKLVKGTNPDAYITGEIWPWAQPWLNGGDQFDAVMNYQFAMPAQAFFVNVQKQLRPTEFSSRLNQLQMAYPFDVSLAQMNLFDSHDTDRVASMFVNPDRPYDAANRPQDNAADWPYSADKPSDEHWQRLMGAATVQYTFVGSPMIYYGTEAGMWSPDDPSNRQPMLWRDLMPYDDARVTFNEKLFAHYQRLAAIRMKFDALRDGLYVPVVTDDASNVLVYRRSNGKQNVYVVVNRSNQPRNVDVKMADGEPAAKLVNWLDPIQATLTQPARDDATARPTLSATRQGGVAPVNGIARLTIAAWGTAVLAE
jgi:cyclomaltodextrinase